MNAIVMMMLVLAGVAAVWGLLYSAVRFGVLHALRENAKPQVAHGEQQAQPEG